MSRTYKGGSINKIFYRYFTIVISGKEQVKMFVNTIEESAKNRSVRTPVAARQIKGEAELRNFMKEWDKANAD